MCVAGKKYFSRDGEVVFPPTPAAIEAELYKKTYRTRWSGAEHNGQIYAPTNDNVRLAIRRLTCYRRPDDPAFDDMMMENQARFIDDHESVFRTLSNTYEQEFNEYLSAEEEARDHHADPHPKKLLRVGAWKDLEETGERWDRLWVKSVLYKMKKDEVGKAGKYPRMIGDLGVAASLQGFRLTECLKDAQSKHPLIHHGTTIVFVKSPELYKLHEVFDNMADPPGRGYFAYFSDDSVYSVRTPQGVHMYNVDIKNCDASHSPALFELLTRIVPDRLVEDMQVLIDQCELPIRIVDVGNPKRKVVLCPLRRRLYSGSTITTGINNVANQMIAMAFAEATYTGPESLMAAAARVGYEISLQRCELLEDVQFLKYSPCEDIKGIYRPVLNPGVLVRSLGQCKGDLPGRGDLLTRGAKFNVAVLRGMYPRTSFPVLHKLEEANGKKTEDAYTKVVHRELSYKVVDSEYPLAQFTDVAVFKRYRLEPHEFDHLDEYATAGPGVFTANSALDRILDTDYGLGCPW